MAAEMELAQVAADAAALAVEAMERHADDHTAALYWLRCEYRPAPDSREREVIAQACEMVTSWRTTGYGGRVLDTYRAHAVEAHAA
jgi:hypothetical protein